MADKIHIYTDGSCSPNPGIGGWGVIMVYKGYKKEIYSGKTFSTNNEMELTAILEGLKAVKDKNLEVIVYSDSEYSINSITKWSDNWLANGWRTAARKEVKNKDLLIKIKKLINKNVKFQWVKGHNNNKYNEMAHRAAEKGRMSIHGDIVEIMLT